MAGDFEILLTDLPRTPGAQVDFRLDGEFHEAVTSNLISLPQGTILDVEGTLESVGDGVLVTASATGQVDARCSRCLKEFTYGVDVEVMELFVYPEKAEDYQGEDVSFVAEDRIDLSDPLRDQIILDQPLILLCDPDCPGLCPSCGVDLTLDPTHSHDDGSDSRWSQLAQWGKMS